jgi:hypothetical protein
MKTLSALASDNESQPIQASCKLFSCFRESKAINGNHLSDGGWYGSERRQNSETLFMKFNLFEITGVCPKVYSFSMMHSEQ